MHDARNLLANKQTQPLNNKEKCTKDATKHLWLTFRTFGMTAAPLLIGMSSRTSTPWAKEGLMSIRGNSLQVIIIAFILVNIWRLIWALSNPYHDGQDVEDILRWQSLGRPSPLAATTSDFTFTAMESDWTKAGDHVDDNNYNNYMKVGVRIGRCQCPLLWPGLAHAGRFILPLLLIIMMITIFF